ncbi:MAG: alpha/beta hydrolase-fold protein [Gemmatimonadaceae bacterium]
MSSRRGFVGWSTAASVGAAAALAIAAGPVMSDKTAGTVKDALVHPELFGNVLSLSGAFWRGYAASNDPPYEWLAGQYAAQPRHGVRFFMDVGALETRRALGSGPVFIEATRRFRDALRSKGYQVVYTEVPGGNHSPESWVRQLPAGIVALSR